MARAKRTRDYRLEEQRRNAKARELGFTSRAQMRRALRQGTWTPVRASSSPRSRIVGSATPPPTRPEINTLAKLRRESREWSNKHSRVPTSRYNPDMTAAQVRAYHAAYVDDDTRAYRIENGLDSLRAYLVDEMGYYTDDEFDDRY